MHLKEIPPALSRLKEEKLLRAPDDMLERTRMENDFGRAFIDAASNDYLGLRGCSISGSTDGPPESTSSTHFHPIEGGQSVEFASDVSRETGTGISSGFAKPDSPIGAGSSRLIFGSHPEHLELEKQVACWLGFPSALLFASGYAANVGALGALLSPDDAVFSDSLNHASLIDGIRLSRARAQVFPHLDLNVLRGMLSSAKSAAARWVVVESYYSMDGDGPDLKQLRALCDRYDAHLYVDEAHSVGTFGPRGAGLCARDEVLPDVLVAAFGKAVGAQGACVLGAAEVRTWLWNRARSFVFSTAPSPLLTEAIRAQVLRTEVASSQRSNLAAICRRVRHRLSERGVSLSPGSFGPVVGLILGDEERALGVAARLRENGILAQAVRPPTVPRGRSRVRLVLRAGWSEDQCERLCEAVARETNIAASP